MERITPFDLVIFLALLAMFVAGYVQGIIRRLMGIGAIIFSIVLAAQLRQPVGAYLAKEWSTIAPSYSYMVAFGAVFVASVVATSIAIQMLYRPAPLLPKYPVLDEILGGILGVIQGIIILAAIVMILDPYFTQPSVREQVGFGEFGILRTLFEWLDPTLTAALLRDTLIPGIFAVFGFLFAPDVRNAFASLLRRGPLSA